MLSRRPARDIDTFLAGYPDLPSAEQENKSWSRNLRFYMNQERCEPDEMLIDEIHEEWATDYDLLEYNHGYIQWLFPIREHGMNFDAQPLQLREIRVMTSNTEVIKRVLRSYTMMLGFYGMRLMDEETGLLRRSSAFKPRYKNLMYAPHNNLRITRILKCLSELGLEHLSAGLILHVLNEQTEFGHLRSRTLMDSMDRYWVNCIRDDHERGWLNTLLERVRSRRLEFDRQDYERVLTIRKTKGQLAWQMDSGESGQTAEREDHEEEEGEESQQEPRQEPEQELEREPSEERQSETTGARKRNREHESPKEEEQEVEVDDRTRKRLVKKCVKKPTLLRRVLIIQFTSTTGHDDDFTFLDVDGEWPDQLQDEPWERVEDESDDDYILQEPGKGGDPEPSKRLDESLHSLEEQHQPPVTALLESNLGEKEDAEDLPDFPTKDKEQDH
ncbi:hypothetical protein FRB90_004230, partial [Tulasnella sp. 427]